MESGQPYFWQMIILAIWSILWKGIALWKCVKFNQRNWFISILVISDFTFGILAILYLFWFAKKRMTFATIEAWVRNILSRSK